MEKTKKYYEDSKVYYEKLREENDSNYFEKHIIERDVWNELDDYYNAKITECLDKIYY